MRLFLIFTSAIILILLGCREQFSTENVGKYNYSQPIDEQLISSLENQLQFALKSGGMSPESYNQIDSQLVQLEPIYPERVKKLRDMLEKIPVGGQKKEISQPNASITSEVASSSFDALVREINDIYNSKTSVSTEHADRMRIDLNYYEYKGMSQETINGLREKLKEIDEFGKPGEQPVKDSYHRDYSELPNELEKSTLPDCAGLEFSEYPVDMAELDEIDPLGSINPPGHTFPTEHSYLHLYPSGTNEQLYELRAPADVTIVHIRTDKGATKDPEDSTIYFALCKDYYGYYNHIKKISDGVLELMKDKPCVYMQETCTRNVMLPVKKGTVVGYVGGHQGNFDFGIIDLTKKNQFANPSRYGLRSFHVQCAYDYYKADMKEKFFSLIKRKDANRCGLVAQDVNGTLKGNWFYEDSRADMGTDWNRHLSFVEYNIDPEKLVVGIGGVISDAKKIMFLPKDSGTANRRFEDVKPDGKVYCFSDDSSKVIVKMIDEDTISIKHSIGQCLDAEQLFDGFEYNR